MITFTATNKTE